MAKAWLSYVFIAQLQRSGHDDDDDDDNDKLL